MEQQNMEKFPMMNKDSSNFLQTIADDGNFKLEAKKERIDFSNGFIKMGLTADQKKNISALIQHFPSVSAANTLANAYVVNFPDGLPETLVRLKRGGFGSMIRGENGQFVGHASFIPVAEQAVFLSAFNVMAIASSQYYLTQINKELKVIRQNIDKILEFLYGDKRAELLSEVNFVKYAYENYQTIMNHETQRIATIVGLQEAKKVAIKDMEFYINDLESKVNGKVDSDVIALVNETFRIKDSLEMSMQLYGMSNVLEMYYSQNHEDSYLKYIEDEITFYISKCEKRMLSIFSALNVHINKYKGGILKKVDTSEYEKEVGRIIDSLNGSDESSLKKSLCVALEAINKDKEYYICNDGNVYLKAA